MEKNIIDNHVLIASTKIAYLLKQYCDENNILNKYDCSFISHLVFFNLVSSSLKSCLIAGCDKKVVMDFGSNAFKEIMDNLEKTSIDDLKNIKKDL